LKKFKDLGLPYIYKDGFFFFKLSDLACSQIWLNLPADYRHFGYITNLMEKNHCLGHEAWVVRHYGIGNAPHYG